VFKVFDHQAGEFLAMKEIALDTDGGADSVAVQREVALLAGLSHPHVVQIRHAELRDPRRARIFMEWMSGGSLQAIAKATSRTFTATAIARYMCHALSGLQYLHAAGIVHRDIKPGNLLLSGDVLKLADFGLAVVRASSTAATTNGLAGTPMYLSPEAVRGSTTAASDVWALGCTALELFTGRQPWAHLASEIDMSTAMPLLFRLGTAPPPATLSDFSHAPPLPTVGDDVTSAFVDFLRCCFAYDATLRPTAEALLRHPFVSQHHHAS
jgi:mitogen-activated protein kinase kinase kinase